ncbi:MAG: esterase YqiA [Aeromonadaceae bacterium]|nr:esterase YqiA [Aeromonadaceae bacterium]
MAHTLIYLHGFHSSPGSLKARQMGAYLQAHHPQLHYRVPTLPDLPQPAWQAVTLCVEAALAQGSVGVMGSSMGGFWATRVAQQYGLPAVVINPAVRPDRLMAAHFLGPQCNPHTGVQYHLGAEQVDQLAALCCNELSQTERLWLLQQQGDELLDYRQALALYQGCRVTLEPGGSHAFEGFERYCPAIVEFLAFPS